MNTTTKYFAGIAIALVAATVFAHAATPTPPVVISGSDLLTQSCDPDATVENGARDWETEASIAVSPLCPDNIVATWTQDWADATAAAYSFNGGSTWHQVIVPQDRCGHKSAHDSWISFGREGIAYISTVLSGGTDSDGNALPQELVLNRSLDGGQTWSQPIVIDTTGDSATDTDNFIEKPMIVADPLVRGRVYAVWERGTFPATRVCWFSVSTNGGKTWSSRVAMYNSPPGQLATGNQLVILPDGSLIDIFSQIPLVQDPRSGFGQQASQTGPTTLLAVKSVDHGKTWSSVPAVIAPIADASHYVLATAAVSSTGTTYVAWQTSRDPACAVDDATCTAVVYSKSDALSGGLTWSAPQTIVSVAGPPMTGLNNIVAAPGFAVAKDGTLAAMFYDHRANDPSKYLLGDPPHTTDAWFYYLPAGGAKWIEHRLDGSFDQTLAFSGSTPALTMPPPPVDGGSIPPVTTPQPQGDVGEYQGLVATPNGFAMAFAKVNPTSVALHNTDIFFSKAIIKSK